MQLWQPACMPPPAPRVPRSGFVTSFFPLCALLASAPRLCHCATKRTASPLHPRPNRALFVARTRGNFLPFGATPKTKNPGALSSPGFSFQRESGTDLLSRGIPRTIIGAAPFHGPVRDGKAWFQSALGTRHSLLPRCIQTAKPIRKKQVGLQSKHVTVERCSRL